MKLLAGLTATAAAAAIVIAAATPALASAGPRFYANDVRGTGRFGPAVTGTAQQDISTLTGRYQRDPATFAEVAAFAHFKLPGGTSYLLKHPAAWHAAADRFGAYLRSKVREEVSWTSAYRTAFAVPHGSKPTTFGWTAMPDLTRDVLVFDGFALVMNCGGQPYIPAKAIPLPAKPHACKPARGGHKGTCAPCAAGTKLFNVPGVGAMCLCPQTVHVIVSNTRTVSVTVITTVTNTTSTTTTVSYGKCKEHAKCPVKS